jgi:hypothetical protein
MLTEILLSAGLVVVAVAFVAVCLQSATPSLLAEELVHSITHEPSRWKEAEHYQFKRDDGLILSVLFKHDLSIREPQIIELPRADRRIVWKAYKNHHQYLRLKDVVA